MRRALIIVDHGSEREAANRMLEDLAAQVQRLTMDAVYPAHMELAEPTIGQAFDAAVAGGADFVFIFPYFLAPGRHSREDIPRLCAEAAARHPGVEWHCAGPIGLDKMMAQLIVHRVRRCQQYEFQCDECPDNDYCRPAGEF
ncbi:MAG: cobalamin biosynthesis protein CbiX [Planctomycetes bacterium]|nr:cobalamin biosynthesis protein CbiX [Planctomycetota bacterium]